MQRLGWWKQRTVGHYGSLLYFWLSFQRLCRQKTPKYGNFERKAGRFAKQPSLISGTTRSLDIRFGHLSSACSIGNTGSSTLCPSRFFFLKFINPPPVACHHDFLALESNCRPICCGDYASMYCLLVLCDPSVCTLFVIMPIPWNRNLHLPTNFPPILRTSWIKGFIHLAVLRVGKLVLDDNQDPSRLGTWRAILFLETKQSRQIFLLLLLALQCSPTSGNLERSDRTYFEVLYYLRQTRFWTGGIIDSVQTQQWTIHSRRKGAQGTKEAIITLVFQEQSQGLF